MNYRTSLPLLLLCVATVFACTKKEDIIECPAAPEGITTLAGPGSYWVYQWYNVDSLGVETLNSAIDTVQVLGDTLIDGLSYHIYASQFFGPNYQIDYRRESFGNAYNSAGDLLYSSVTLDVPYDEGETDLGLTPEFQFHKIDQAAGSNQFVHRVEFWYEDGTPTNSCGDLTFSDDRTYEDGIGEVSYTSRFFGAWNTLCRSVRRDLVEYHISE